MAPKDRERLRRNGQRIALTLERNRETLDAVRGKSAKYAETIASSEAAIQNARSDLRKAGYLK